MKHVPGAGRAPRRAAHTVALLAPVMVLAAALAGCASTVPAHGATDANATASLQLAAYAAFRGAARPDVPTAPAAAAAPATAAFDDGAWWRRFDDLVLDQLVDAALAANHDVRIALARVEQARAGVDLATSRLLPSVDAIGVRARDHTAYDEAARQRLPDTDVRRGGLNVSWEVDLFGAARAARGAAAADLLAVEHARRGAQLAVISEVAAQYFTLRGAHARLAIVDSLVDSEQQTLRLTELRRAAGQASDFDVDRAQAELATTEAARPPLRALVDVAGYRLAVLTGRSPGSWDAAFAATADAPLPAPLAVAPGQPAELLQRRPDLMAAEAQLRAAGFRDDEAHANRFPRLMLSALFGTQWTAWNALDLGRTGFSNLAATLALPLYAGGRIQAGIDAANARQSEALAGYEKTILQALEEVESSLTVLNNDAARAQDLDRSVAARERSLGRARALYREGEADLLVVLDVERGLLANRLDRASLGTDQLLAVVQLYRALGGGWKAAETVASTPAPQRN
jgi:NodT family efflux transporter outer membrane factor (OMF) lipoprotein